MSAFSNVNTESLRFLSPFWLAPATAAFFPGLFHLRYNCFLGPWRRNADAAVAKAGSVQHINGIAVFRLGSHTDKGNSLGSTLIVRKHVNRPYGSTDRKQLVQILFSRFIIKGRNEHLFNFGLGFHISMLFLVKASSTTVGRSRLALPSFPPRNSRSNSSAAR